MDVYRLAPATGEVPAVPRLPDPIPPAERTLQRQLDQAEARADRARSSWAAANQQRGIYRRALEALAGDPEQVGPVAAAVAQRALDLAAVAPADPESARGESLPPE